MRVFIGLGSNIEGRIAYLRSAVAALDRHPDIEVVARSHVYETEPVGPEQPEFLNAVVGIETELAPRTLLDVLKSIETELGRRAGERWAPREIDLDLLLYGDRRVDEPGLQVPHPEIGNREFVLVPLTEIAPEAEVPSMGPASALLARLDRSGVRPTDLLLD